MITRVLLTLFIGTALLCGCGESEKQKTDRIHAESVRRVDSLTALLKPRKDIYDAAISMAKENLRSPSSARFAELKLQNDSVKIVMHGADTAAVYSYYEAQNAYGVFLAPTQFKSTLARTAGKWLPAHGETFKFMDVRMSYSPAYDNDQIK